MYTYGSQMKQHPPGYGGGAGNFGTFDDPMLEGRARQPYFGSDGGETGKADVAHLHKTRRPINIFAAATSLVVPCIIFAADCGALSFLTTTSVAGAWAVIVIAAFIALVWVGLAAMTLRKRQAGLTESEPYWYIFIAASVVLAWATSVWLGVTNQGSNVAPYVDLQSLSARFNVDPATAQGQQLMDVGRVVFTKGSHLDLTRSMGFRNVNNYCVAPIVSGNATLASYDFWAIGLDCCRGNPSDFRCGEYSNPLAHAGLRVMRADQRAFYRLAVQQAEAAYGITAKYPIFFYWMEDPVAELESYMHDATQFFWLASLCFLGLQTLLVLVAVFIRTKL